MALEPFQLVVERHARHVWRFCASQVGVDRADDCFQDTMLAALRAYPRLREDSSVRPWLLRIAAHKAIDMHRANARDPVPSANVELGTSDPPGLPDPSLFDLVRQLPRKQRLAVAYRVVGDLSYRDIGALMDTSEEAARRNVHEALKTLRARVPVDLTPAARSTSNRA